MTTDTAADVNAIRSRLASIGQDHILRFHDELDEAGRRRLLADIASIDLDALPTLIEQYVTNNAAAALPEAPEPAPYYPADPDSPVRSWDRAAYRKAGEDLISAGKIAAFTVAGGQGTRLGFDGPKGTFPGGAVSGKPLFECLAEWIIAAQDRYDCTIPWYIMTSPLNHEPTVAFFKQHRYFGLDPDDVMLFQQGVMPSLQLPGGKLMLASKDAIATNPDGHGGSLRALHASNALADMRSRGIEQISYTQIDNPLARVIDPVFIGLHATAPDSSGEMSSKMVAKTEPGEKVGVFCRVDGRTQVMEYSDMPEALAEARDERGALRYNAGSIAIHMISVDFAERLTGGSMGLPYHRAVKKVPYVDDRTGERVEPAEPNAVKLEMFVFDALPLAERSLVYEVDRVEEFAPIKNAEGQDSPASSREIQTIRGARWLEQVGVRIPGGAASPECVIEVSPLTAMWPEDLDRGELPDEVVKGAELEV